MIYVERIFVRGLVLLQMVFCGFIIVGDVCFGAQVALEPIKQIELKYIKQTPIQLKTFWIKRADGMEHNLNAHMIDLSNNELIDVWKNVDKSESHRRILPLGVISERKKCSLSFEDEKSGKKYLVLEIYNTGLTEDFEKLPTLSINYNLFGAVHSMQFGSEQQKELIYHPKLKKLLYEALNKGEVFGVTINGECYKVMECASVLLKRTIAPEGINISRADLTENKEYIRKYQKRNRTICFLLISALLLYLFKEEACALWK